jgi:hypothetical protein
MSRTLIVVAAIAGAAWLSLANSSADEEEWPLSLELIWETPEKGAPVFVDGFPPPEIKAAFEDTSIPEEDKEWVLNNIRVWAAYRAKKLWLDDGSTMEIPVVEPGDRLQTFTIFSSRNKKYWLVRAMRFEGPEIPPEPEPPAGGKPTPEFAEAKSARLTAQWAQKAHWREVFMDVEGRIYWEKEFGPYDTHLEDQWYGEVVAHISDDGEMVVKIGARKGWFCGKAGECVERDGFSYLQRTALSADGSTFVVHTGGGPYDHRVDFGRRCGLQAYDRTGELKWASEVVPGGTGGRGGVVGVSPDGSRAAFIAVASRGTGTSHRTDVNEYLVNGEGITLAQDGLGSKGEGRVRFSMDGRRLYVTYPHLHLVRARGVETGRLLWEYRTEDWIAVVTPSRETGIVAIMARGGSLTVLSPDGEPLLCTQRPNAEVFLSPNGALLLEKAGWLKFSRLVVEE